MQLANQYGMKYFETSALTGENVEEVCIFYLSVFTFMAPV